MEGTLEDSTVFHDIEDAAEGFIDFNTPKVLPAKLKVHLGRNVFAVARKSHSNIDIRHNFFINDKMNSLHPTRRGISMSLSDFNDLERILQ